MNRKLLDLIPTFFLSLFGRNKPTTHTLDDHGDDLGIGGDDKQRNNANTVCQSWFAVTKYAFVSDLFSDYEGKTTTPSLDIHGDDLGIGGDDKQCNDANTGCQSWFAVTKYAFVSDLFSDYESKPATHSLNVRGDNDSSSVESTDDEQQPERDVK